MLSTNSNNIFRIFLISKQSYFKRSIKLLLNLNILYNFLSVSFGQTKVFVSKLSIRLSRIFLYLLVIITILDFFFACLTIYLNIYFKDNNGPFLI